MEGNEWSFCSMWTEDARLGCARALINNRLDGDYFFNRSTVSGCDDPYAAAKHVAAKIYWKRGFNCYLYDREGLLENQGFPQIDTMYVLRSATVGTTSDRTVITADKSILSVWVEVFCRAFSVPEWMAEVERIMRANLSNLTLLLSFKGNMPAGCAALYFRNGMTGLYCLGTIPQFRGTGLATSILKNAARISENLFLQTLSSENLLSFYQKAGFKAAYAKKIYILAKPNMY